jgi:hypothetical protein
MESIRSLYGEMLGELQTALDGDQQGDLPGLVWRANAALQYVDSTKQSWPVVLPPQPSLDDWLQVETNRQSLLRYLMRIGVLSQFGTLMPAWVDDFELLE